MAELTAGTMTDRSTNPMPARERRGTLGAIWAATAIFLALLALLATRVATGRDPMLRAHAAAIPVTTRRILIRRVYERRVIVHLPPSAPTRPTRASQQLSAPGGYAPPLAVTRTS
ncbi:MAG: hypothetical protein WA484_05810 [Solirubrobacteraceae bacterium]